MICLSIVEDRCQELNMEYKKLLLTACRRHSPAAECTTLRRTPPDTSAANVVE